MAIEPPRTSNPENTSISGLLNEISADRFQDWYRERQHRQNIENGTPYFNGPDRVPDPERHSPSSLLQCHRKVFYRQCNAPAEQPDPDGIFWFGSRFEEDIVFPFLERAVTDPDTYVRNTMWIDTSIETAAGEVRIKGATDPVIVDEDSTPILPIEVKTKSSLDHVDSPNRHHRAQVHAYLVGLSEKYDVDLRDAAILYGGRKSMDLKVFHVEFDDEFWEDVVLEWAREHTQYRLDDELPPATPEYDWECEFCDYRERCGKGETETDGFGPLGLIPLYRDYPRESLRKYLGAHDGAKLTPTTAQEYPALAGEFGVFDWMCSSCGGELSWTDVEWKEDSNTTPICPHCAQKGKLADLRSSSVDRQREYIEGK